MSLQAWISRYIGIPYRANGRDLDGCDCYGLVVLVLRREFGCQAPRIDRYPGERSERAELAEEWARDEGVWIPKSPAILDPGDVLLLRVAGLPIHCGIAVGERRFLHTLDGCGSCLDRADSPMWRLRIHGAYRHRDLVAAEAHAHG